MHQSDAIPPRVCNIADPCAPMHFQTMPMLLRCLLAVLTGLASMGVMAQTLILESWRTEDQALWDRVLLPAFHAHHPDIRVRFAPTARALYDSTLSTRLDKGLAGDLITCRPFDTSRRLYENGHLITLDGAPSLEHYPASALSAWQSPDGTHTFCLPVASVMHGIFYNPSVFRRIGAREPATQSEWFALMERLREIPGLVPLAVGTADRWESHQLLFTNIGPTHWAGEVGRQRLLTGQSRLTDTPYVQAWHTLQRLTPFMPQGYQALSYDETMDLFGRGLAAMRPGGSWEIAQLRSYRLLDLGVFAPPRLRPDSTCQVSDHADLGIGINTRSRHIEAARAFLAWVASAEFSQLYANAATGFYPLSRHTVTFDDPLARRMQAWRTQCQTTIRLNAQVLNGGDELMEEAFWDAASMVMNHQLTPEQAAVRLQRKIDQTSRAVPIVPGNR